MAKSSKNRASKNAYISPSQITIEGFESPFEQELDSNNRWVKLSKQISWDLLVNTYQSRKTYHRCHSLLTGYSLSN